MAQPLQTGKFATTVAHAAQVLELRTPGERKIMVDQIVKTGDLNFDTLVAQINVHRQNLQVR